MISTWITVNTLSCQLCKWQKSSKLHSCWASISFIWTRVTAADFDLQQSPYATPLLTPALFPIGGVRHKILTRSMRFLHTPPTGNHSRGEERGRYEKQRWEEEESGDSSKPSCLLLRSCEREVREEHEAAALTWNKRMSAVTLTQTLLMWLIKNAGIPLSYLCCSETQQQKTRATPIFTCAKKMLPIFSGSWFHVYRTATSHERCGRFTPFPLLMLS